MMPKVMLVSIVLLKNTKGISSPFSDNRNARPFGLAVTLQSMDNEKFIERYEIQAKN